MSVTNDILYTIQTISIILMSILITSLLFYNIIKLIRTFGTGLGANKKFNLKAYDKKDRWL